MPSPLTTLDSVRSYMRLVASDTRLDDAIETGIVLVEDELKYLFGGRIIQADDYVLDIDGTGTDELKLLHYPINSVTSIRVDGDQVFDGRTVVDSGVYAIDKAAGIIKHKYGRWPEGTGNIRVTYNGGFPVVPADIERLCNVLIAEWCQREEQIEGGQGQGEISNESISGGRTTAYASTPNRFGVPDVAKRIVERYCF
jgi:hypothetical protein